MTVQHTHWLSNWNVMDGLIEEHLSVVTGRVSFYCGCGDNININVRKAHNEKNYRFVVSHRNKENTLWTADPGALQVFDRMYKVSSGHYKTCNWPK